jgi:UDP-N-acetylmuramoyl-tripeptide--D-alanyl-D-alanine ligase
LIPLTLAEVAAATRGRLGGNADPAAEVTADAVLDSRTVTPGALFVAVPGEHVDGHDFAGVALSAGATAVLAERELDVPCVVVGSSVQALGALAAEVLHRLKDAVVVAVTGSSGKTSTKDLVAAVLGAQAPTVAPVGSFNNELGVPLTVLRADAGTKNLVLEMGARGVGHIAQLCAIATPHIGVVLNVGSAHAGEFGSLDVVEKAKGELVEALPPADGGGVAVLNADDERVSRMAARTRARVVRFGTGTDADVLAQDVELDDRGRPAFTLVSRLPEAPGQVRVQLPLVGEHHVSNALAAAAVALVRGAALDGVASSLAAAQPSSRWRMEVVERRDGVTVVNDAYNANPDSMRAALKALAALGRPTAGGRERRRTWAVLGEMLELGEGSVREHDAIGRLAVRLDVSRLVAVGEGARPVHTGAVQEGSWGQESVWVPDADAAFELLASELEPGDVVLVKSSNGIGLRHLGDRLAAAEVPAS